MATQTTDIPLSASSSKSRTGSDNLEAEAIGLEVPVRVSGTQSTSVMGTTEHAEPFQEETTTMIVFPRGAVVKLLARVRTGQSLELMNLRANLKIPCRVIQVTSTNNSVFYVKLEFTQAAQGFWGIHFPSDPPPSARKQESAPIPAPAQPIPAAQPALPSYSSSPSFVDPISVPPPAKPAQAPARDIFEHAAVPPRPIAPLLNENPAPVSPSAYASPSAPPVVPKAEPPMDERTFSPAIEPAAPPREVPKPEPPKEEPASKSAPAYGPARTWQKEQIEPLAGVAASSSVESAVAALVETPAPAPAAEKIPVPGRRPKSATPARKPENRRAKPVRPVFGELHTFSSAPSASALSSSTPSSSIPSPLSKTTFNLSSVARGSAPRSRSKLFPVLVTACILTVIAAAVTYVRRNSTASGSANATATAAPALSAPAAPAETEPQAAPPQPEAPASSDEVSTPSTPLAAPVEKDTVSARKEAPAPKPIISAKPSKASSQTRSASAASATDSNQPADKASVQTLYAGDLNARPKISTHAAKRMDAEVPEITAAAPAGIPDATNSASLDSIVTGGASGLAAPVAPAAPDAGIRQGGSVQPPKLISSVSPVYPSLARQNGVQGDVVIHAEIGISGNVTSMKVLSGPVLLRDAAMNALRKWRYAPAKLDGKPIATQYDITIQFRLGQ